MSYQEQSDEIRDDIEETRRGMSEKINQIQDRLSPENLKAQASAAANEFATATAESVTEYFRNNSADMGRTVVDVIRRNPIPAALVMAGLGWMVVASLSSDDDGTPSGYPSTSNYRTQNQGGQYAPSDQNRSSAYWRKSESPRWQSDQEPGLAEKASNLVSNAAHAVQDKAQELKQQAGERINEVMARNEEGHSSFNQSASGRTDWKRQSDRYVQQGVRYTQQVGTDVQDFASEAVGAMEQDMTDTRNAMRQSAEQAGSYVQQAGQQAREEMNTMGNQVQRTLEENPLIFGAVTLAVGTAIGLMLPQTRSENRLLGSMSDQLRDTTQAAASNVASNVMQRAQETFEEVRPELERTAQKVTENLQEAAQNVGNQVKQQSKNVAQDLQNAGQKMQDDLNQEGEEIQDDISQRSNEGRQTGMPER